MKHKGKFLTISALIGTHFASYFTHRDNIILDPLNIMLILLLIVIGYVMGSHYDKKTYLSERDTLTLLPNRRFLEESFPKIVSLTKRNNGKLFVLVIDCDNFKEINNQFGHMMGDIVLRKIGSVLMTNTRKSDLVIRWGGDEFVIIGQHKNEEGLQTFIDRLHGDFVDISESIECQTSVSIGTAIYPDDDLELDSLLRKADQNMYINKCKKRNFDTA